MKLMLAEEEQIDVESWNTGDDCMEGRGFDYVSQEFQITCRPTVISNPNPIEFQRLDSSLRHRAGYKGEGSRVIIINMNKN